MLWVGVHNLGQRLALSLRYGARYGNKHWYWRLGYALWLESLRGPARRPGQYYAEFVLANSAVAVSTLTLASGWTADDFVYGETPLGTAHQLLQWGELGPGQRFCEIGCGRGVVGLVAHLVFGAQVVGFEKVPALADKARWLTRALGVEQHVLIHEDGPYPSADLYFLTPTTWSEQNWQRVQDGLASAPSGSRALVLSQPLPGWTVLAQKSLPYSWGWNQTYLQTKI